MAFGNMNGVAWQLVTTAADVVFRVRSPQDILRGDKAEAENLQKQQGIHDGGSH